MLHTVIRSVLFGLRSPSASVSFVGCTFSPPSRINVAALLVLRIAFQSILTSLSVGLCANLCQVALSPKDQRRVYGRSRGPRSTGGRSMGRDVNSTRLPLPPSFPLHLSDGLVYLQLLLLLSETGEKREIEERRGVIEERREDKTINQSKWYL